MVNIINKYIHEYDLDYTKYFAQNINVIIEEYKKQFDLKKKTTHKDGRPITDVTINSPSILNYIIPKLDKIVNDNYYAGDKLREIGLRCYKQTSEDFFSSLHTHIHVMHSISAVFYLNIPKVGGEIYFNYLNGIGSTGWELKIKPKSNKVYLFPSWLPHTPLPHEDKNVTRLSFNWMYCSDKRATHKATGTVW